LAGLRGLREKREKGNITKSLYALFSFSYKLFKNEIFVSHVAVGENTNRGDQKKKGNEKNQ
jgi:hypothetical protein